MTLYLAVFFLGVTVDLLVIRHLYRRVRAAIRSRRPVRNLRGRVGEYRL